MPRVADPNPVPFWPLAPGSGMGKKSGSGSELNNPDHISESLETIFWDKCLNSLMRDLGWKELGSGIRDGKISDPEWTSLIRNTDNWVILLSWMWSSRMDKHLTVTANAKVATALGSIPATQWKLRGGRWSSKEESTLKIQLKTLNFHLQSSVSVTVTVANIYWKAWLQKEREIF